MEKLEFKNKAESFVKQVNADELDGSGVKLKFDGECFEFCNGAPALLNYGGISPTPLLKNKIKTLFKCWFNGYTPKYNNTESIFWPEKEYRFTVCIHDDARGVSRYKVISTASEKITDAEIRSAFGYYQHEPINKLYVEKLNQNESLNLPLDYWEAIISAENFFIEKKSNRFFLVEEKTF